MKRVCRSTATGETLSLCEGHDAAVWLRHIWKELTGERLKLHLITDSMVLLMNVLTIKLPMEKRLRIYHAGLRAGLRNGEFDISWLPSRANLSDPLTKEADGEHPRLSPCDRMKRPLLDALRSNCIMFQGMRLITKSQVDMSKY
jgi:hypothetical protein